VRKIVFVTTEIHIDSNTEKELQNNFKMWHPKEYLFVGKFYGERIQ
jgi:hypothetical protein